MRPKRRRTAVGVSSERFRSEDVFIDYDFETVMFRFEHSTRRFFKKLYGNSKEMEVASDNRLLNDAIRFGVETDAGTYAAGKASI
jgi:hypothetical protein